jgi:hypothetical protein
MLVRVVVGVANVDVDVSLRSTAGVCVRVDVPEKVALVKVDVDGSMHVVDFPSPASISPFTLM